MKKKIFRVIYCIELELDIKERKGRKGYVSFVDFWYSFGLLLSGCVTHSKREPSLIKKKPKPNNKTLNTRSSSYRCYMKFYIIHSCITHESCTMKSKMFTTSLKYNLSLIQDDVLVCCFSIVEVLHFTISFSLKILQYDAPNFTFFGFWRDWNH